MVSCKVPAREKMQMGSATQRATEEALTCFSTVFCRFCDVCILMCPDMCITRDEKTGMVNIDLDYCKGCGICAHFCPKGAIKMVVERK